MILLVKHYEALIFCLKIFSVRSLFIILRWKTKVFEITNLGETL